MKAIIRKIMIVVMFLLMTTCVNDSYVTHTPANAVFPPVAETIVYVDRESFSIVEYAAVMDAVEEWEKISNGNITFKVVTSWKEIEPYYGQVVTRGTRCYDVVGIVATHGLDPHVLSLEDGKADTTVVGVTNVAPCRHSNIKLVTHRMFSYKEVKWVTMHEIGHVYGMAHTNVDYSLMYRSKTVGKDCNNEKCCVTKVDIAYLCDTIGCDVDTFQYCEKK